MSTGIGLGIGLQFKYGAAAMPALTWWDLDGDIASPTGAYQSIGAASFAASLVNLANPGTYDATVGNAPAWDAVNGWQFDGINDYLDTGIVPGSGWSAIINYTNFVSGATHKDALFGMYESSSLRFAILNYVSRVADNGGNWAGLGLWAAAGTVAMTPTTVYLDGAPIGSITGSWSGAATRQIFFGGRNFGGALNLPAAFLGRAIAIYPYTLSAANVAALATRMAGLPE